MRKWLLFFLCLLAGNCKTYYQKTVKFQRLFEQQAYTAADELLAKDKKAEKRNTRLLYYLDRGVVNHLLGNYKLSNQFFHQAFLFVEDQHKNALKVGASFFFNPTITKYMGEDHEVLLIHYYKALNFVQLGKLDAALVECRQLNIKLQELESKYDSPDVYKRDAFIHLLMGLIYQANHEYNNAFIAYRNALEIYEGDYARFFGLSPPPQLRQDLLYTAYKTGFMDEVAHYEKKWGITFTPPTKAGEAAGSALILWHNGLGPVKDEWSIEFVLVPGAGGVVNFTNTELGLIFPFPLPPSDNASLSDMQILRVAFPKYVTSVPRYTSATATVGEQHFPLQLAEDINAIAFKSLDQRMKWELGKALLRLALKKSTAIAARQAHPLAGIGVDIFNAVSEKADTRNWQTLPHSIHYARLPLAPGTHQVDMRLHPSSGAAASLTTSITIARPKATTFFLLHTPAHLQR